jgi:DNA-binding IclR family transcriptional regulator
MEIRRGTARITEAAEVNGNARTTEPQTTPALLELLQRVEGEYREMPGLSLTFSQAERLWGLDRSTCAFVLMTLIERRVLRQTPNGTYLRGPSG